MKTLKVFAIAIITLGTVTAANAQVQVSLSANFGGPRYLPIYTPAPVIVERPVYYSRPVVYTRPVYRRNVVVVDRSPVYHRTVVVNRPAYYRTNYRPAKFYKQKHGHGHNKHYRNGRY